MAASGAWVIAICNWLTLRPTKGTEKTGLVAEMMTEPLLDSVDEPGMPLSNSRSLSW